MENQKPLIGAYLLLIQNEHLLMQKRKGGTLDGIYTPIAGHTEKGENVIDAIIRESYEEANIVLSKEDLTVKVVVQRPLAKYKGEPTDIIDFFIFADTYSNEIKNMEEEKCSEIKFFPLDNLPESTMPHVKKVVEAYINSTFFIAC